MDEHMSVDVAGTFGVALVGYLISLLLYSVSSAQIFIYLKFRCNLKRPLARVIITLWLLDTLQVILIGHALYYYLVHCRGNLHRLQKPYWSMITMIFPSIWTIGIVQYIWVMRIWTLNRHKWRTVIAYGMLCLVLLDGVTSHIWAIQCFHQPTFTKAVRVRLWETALSVGLITFNDLTQTLYFCHLLHQSRDGLGSTNTLINKLILYGANTGIATCFASVGLLVLILVMPDKFYYMAVYWILQKLYINSLMAMINWTMCRSTFCEVEGAQAGRDPSEAHQLTTIVLADISRYTQFPADDT